MRYSLRYKAEDGTTYKVDFFPKAKEGVCDISMYGPPMDVKDTIPIQEAREYWKRLVKGGYR